MAGSPLFHRLVAKIRPILSEYNNAETHAKTVRKMLNQSFDLKRFLKIGSHSSNTAIRLYSDVDYMAVLSRNEAKWGGSIINSTTFLEKVRDDLDDRYTQTQVSGGRHAVVFKFGSGQHAMGVVPAIFSRVDKLRPIYWVPDGNDGWTETSPELHNKYIIDANEISGSKLANVIRLLKFWKICRQGTQSLQSFYIDMLLASSDVCLGVKSYARCLYDTFQLLADRECSGLKDPLGISGIIRAAKTESQLDDINASVDYSLQHAKLALQAESWGDSSETIHQWGIVFNDQI
jgi:hypothetical protein